MARKRKSYGRVVRDEFGPLLKRWRKEADLNQHDAAKKLGIKGKCPSAYLSQIETCKRPIPDAILLKVPRVYRQPAEKVLKEAYSPQLPLPFLTIMLENDILWEEVQDLLKKSKYKLKKTERKELLEYATFLIMRRQVRKQALNTT